MQTALASTPIDHIIDCDADPFIPDGWKVEEHKTGGQFKWNASQVALYLSKGQQGGKVIEGNKLRKELADKPVYNANLLDYLLKNPLPIPGPRPPTNAPTVAQPRAPRVRPLPIPVMHATSSPHDPRFQNARAVPPIFVLREILQRLPS